MGGGRGGGEGEGGFRIHNRGILSYVPIIINVPNVKPTVSIENFIIRLSHSSIGLDRSNTENEDEDEDEDEDEEIGKEFGRMMIL
jgi:hypothetical protein